MRTVLLFLSLLILVQALALAGCLGREPTSDPADPEAEEPTGSFSADDQASSADWDRDVSAPGNSSMDKTFVNGTVPMLPKPSAAQDEPRSIVVVNEIPNVYHNAFRRATWTRHPAEFVPGYPANATPLYLTLDATDWRTAFEADREIWDSVEPGRIYFFPGTAVIAFTSLLEPAGIMPEEIGPHGSGVAYNALAERHAEEIALAVAYGLPHEVADQAARWPFVDVTSKSSPVSYLPPGGAGEIGRKQFTEQQGGIVVNSVENNEHFNCPQPNWFCGSVGPPWIVAVGRSDEERHVWGSGPMDVAGPHLECARHDSFNGTVSCRGTSFSAPRVAGHMAGLIATVRREWGWRECAPFIACTDDESLWPETGTLSDGRLSREELLAAVYATAGDGERGGTSLTPYRDDGWGIVDDSSTKEALDVLMGRLNPADRPEREEAWRFHQHVRSSYWSVWEAAWQQQPLDCLLFARPGC